ncbi:protein AMN1 homolog isoform X2 [Protopterus annectens]|uniref:protein AMN1 homolog isoform X2 n=1 Tax=Protopterus annectens TaxID=7888 RepID=UPI001CFBFA9B|nr:protein AMN1 homolog isoform X2 [Protopterus annectens]
MSSDRVDRLLDLCLIFLSKNISECLHEVKIIPSEVKDKLIKIMIWNGTLNDQNISQVIHSRLQMLNLQNCNISDEALRQLGNCKQLKMINVGFRSGERVSITSAGIISIASSCPSLKEVYLERCSNVLDEGILAIARNCKHLQILNIGRCSNITDSALYALGQNSCFLQSVKFSATKVTDDGVTALVSGVCSQSLKEVYMDRCVNLTDGSVEAVLNCCPKLHIFIFHECPLITERSREALYPFLRSNQIKQLTWTVY